MLHGLVFAMCIASHLFLTFIRQVKDLRTVADSVGEYKNTTFSSVFIFCF